MLSVEEGERKVSMIAQLGRRDICRTPIVGRRFATCARVRWQSSFADVPVCLDMSTRHCIRRHNVTLDRVDSLDVFGTHNKHIISPVFMTLTLLPIPRINQFGSSSPSRALKSLPL